MAEQPSDPQAVLHSALPVGTSLVVVFVPSQDRNGQLIEQEYWVDEVLTTLGRLFRGATMDARTVAEAGYAAMLQGKPLVIPGLRNKLLAFSVRLAPRRVVTRIARRMQETKG